MTKKKSGKRKGLTKGHAEEYRAGYCPMCGRHGLDYCDTEILDENIGYVFICRGMDCGFEGIEWHVARFDEFSDIDGNPIKKG